MSNIKKNASEIKQQRRAEALRLNLKKRKQQQHARIAVSALEEPLATEINPEVRVELDFFHSDPSETAVSIEEK